jgi:hypothetical protein
MQLGTHEFSEWRIRVNNMESGLGVAKDAGILRDGLYDAVSHNFEILNASIASISKKPQITPCVLLR